MHRLACWGRTLASPDFLIGDNFPRNIELVERLRQLANEQGLTVAQLALSWVLRDPLVATAITSPRRVDQVEESVGGSDANLTDQCLEMMDGIAQSAAGLVEKLPE